MRRPVAIRSTVRESELTSSLCSRRPHQRTANCRVGRLNLLVAVVPASQLIQEIDDGVEAFGLVDEVCALARDLTFFVFA